MSILFFTKGDRSVPSSRERVWVIAERLQKDFSFEYTILFGFQYPWWLLSRSRFIKLREARRALRDSKYDIIFVHKSLFAWDILFLILFSGKNIVYDLDDAEWLHSPLKSRLLARRAVYIFCGSHAILKWAQKHNKNSALVPSVVDNTLYAHYTVTHGAREIITLGWVGQGRAHFKAGNFEIIKKPLNVFAAQGYAFRLVIIGSQNYAPLKEYFKNVIYPVEFIDDADWERPSTVPAMIKKYEVDIGVMPLVSTSFNEAKCAYKAVQFMACGVPTVASSVGEACYRIEHGKNGFLAASNEEWVSALTKLSNAWVSRKIMGERAQKTISSRYSFDCIVPMMHDIFMSHIFKK